MLCAYDCYVNGMIAVWNLLCGSYYVDLTVWVIQGVTDWYSEPSTYTLTVLSQVISSSAYVDSKTIPHTDGARSSRVLVPLPDDPYMAVRQAYLATTDIKSKPVEDPLEVEIPQSPRVVPSSILPLTTHHTEDLEASDPSETKTISPSDSTTPPSPDHPLTQTAPT
ncbi:hypothetical protein Tco_1264013 [Tanacetum coccineum]